MSPSQPFAILFVCMGNICRSPTAEGVVRARAQAAGVLNRLHLDSAGTHGYHIGCPPDARSCHAALRRGIDLSALRSRQVRAEDFIRFDLILAMERSNMTFMQPWQAAGQAELDLMLRFGTLGETEVPDPYYSDGQAGFECVLDLLEDAAEGLLAAFQAGKLSARR